VVIPTRNRAARLKALLDSLAAQAAPEFEVVVVDDGSTDATARVLAEPPMPVRAVRGPGRGPAAARNLGWRAARGRVVCFTDDDCRAAPGWVAALLDAVGGADAMIAVGRTEPEPSDAGRQSAYTRSNLVTGLNRDFHTCNIAYPRALLERLGGFDESFRHPAGEDTELAWRALESGAAPRFADGALVWHAVHDVGWAELVKRARWRTDVPRLVRRHPGLRHHMHRGIFWKREHALLAAALIGIALGRFTRGASLALALPYVRFCRGLHGSYAGTLAHLPAQLAVDGAEVAALVVASARERTLVI
jgi:glycosyltransferase involved in cell wall biosynthesis